MTTFLTLGERYEQDKHQCFDTDLGTEGLKIE